MLVAKSGKRLLICSMILAQLMLLFAPMSGSTALAQAVPASSGQVLTLPPKGSAPRVANDDSAVTSSATVIVDVPVAASSDDAEERADGSMALGGSDLELVFDRGGHQTVGLRFNEITIPQAANITSAYVQFQADETAPQDPTDLTIQGVLFSTGF